MSSTPSSSDLELRLRRARASVFALFLTNGALFANIIPRYPQIKDIFGLSEPVYGLTIALFPLGALVFGGFAARAIRRFSSARTAVAGTMGIGAMLAVAGLLAMRRESMGEDAGSVGFLLHLGFACFFFLAGGFDAVTDVGQNAHGLRIQRLMGRPIINSFHAGWSIGAMLGGLMGIGATALDLPLGVHLFGSALVFVAVGLVALGFALPGADPHAGQTDPILLVANAGGGAEDALGASPSEMRVHAIAAPPYFVVGALTLLAIAGMLMEDAISTWSSLYMRDYLGVKASLAGAAFVVMLASQAIGRLTADRLMERLGNRNTVLLGGALVTLGMGLAVLAPSVPTTLIGMAFTGYGCAAIVPIAYNAADDVPGLAPGTGLTIVTWLSRFAFLGAPPLVGLIVEATSLRASMIVVPVAGLLALLVAFVIAPQRAEAGGGAS